MSEGSWEYSHQRVINAIAAARGGMPVLIQDAQGRENEVDCIIPGRFASPEAVNTALHHARGLLCVAVSSDVANRMGLTLVKTQFSSRYDTGFTMSVDVREGTTTGISAHDRSATIQAITDGTHTLKDFVVPGHVFPVMALNGGVLERQGHTEAAVDLMRLAGLEEVALMSEVLDDDGRSLRGDAVPVVSQKHGWPVVHVDDIRDYRLRTQSLVRLEASAFLPTIYGQFEALVYTMAGEAEPIVALIRRGVRPHWSQDVLVRLHSQCFTGDVLRSLRCDCGDQLVGAMDVIERTGEGIFLYLPQEGRGIGLAEKIRAYALQEQGLDTVDANLRLGHPVDARQYGFATQVLKHIGLRSITLLTNNPSKVEGIERYGISVAHRQSLETTPTKYNIEYLNTKKERLGHILDNALQSFRA